MSGWPKHHVMVGLLAASVIVVGLTPPTLAQQDEDEDEDGWQAVDERFMGEAILEPTFAWEEPAELTPAEQELIRRKVHQMRERMAAHVDNDPPGASDFSEFDLSDDGLDDGLVETWTDSEFSPSVVNPQTLVIGRNNRNAQAQLAGNDTIAEPAAANNGPLVFAAGNFSHAEFSSNGGMTWTDVPLPGGPADAPFLCCDHDVVIDDARRTVFHSALYANVMPGTMIPTNGIVRIFVRHRIDSTTATCSYDVDPAGPRNNVFPDFPHLGLTSRFLYLTITARGSGGNSSRIFRFNIDEIDNCERTTGEFFDQPFSRVGRRAWVPSEGTNNSTAMFWIQHDNSSTMRIFRWLEDNARVDQRTRTIQRTNFGVPGTNVGDPDCRGGVGDFDWLRAADVSIVGFNHRCTLAPGALNGESVLACYWNAAPTGPIIQGHVRSAVFRLSDFSVIAQPHIFNQDFCFGYPAVTANSRGDIGISIALGGRAGGGGSAVQGGVGIDDEFTPGIGFFPTIFFTASGIANRPDGRFGDYFTIHPYEPCEKWFSATNYAWDNAPVDDPQDVNSRYIEFGREQSRRCYEAHRDQIPVQ